jgi:hypothetical protein
MPAPVLPQEHCDMCRKAIDMADEILPFAEQCKECGLPVDGYIEAIKNARLLAANMLKVFHNDKSGTFTV